MTKKSKSKTLIIVESPSKGAKIQELLGDDYIVAASKGHITDLAKGGKFGLGVDVANDFKPRYVLMEDKIDVLDNLLNLGKQCDIILLASDNDREGTSIAWHLAQRLADLDKPMKRMVFEKITKPILLKAIKEAGEIDMNIVHAQEGRRILDRLVGFMASPFLMTFFGPKLSAGRVQSVVSRMIIDREREIDAFKPEEFWTIQASLSKDGKQGFLTKYSGRPTNATDANLAQAKLTGKQFIVSDVVSQEEAKFPSAPLITSTLQRTMSKEYGVSSEDTMKASQSLYENGYISYIRTDSVRIADEDIAGLRQWLGDNKHSIPQKPYTYKNKDAAQDAHECIHPTNIDLLPTANHAVSDPTEKLVYEVVWKYFVASQMLPAVYDTLKMTAHAQGDKTAEVKASGKALKSKGFLDILGVNDDSKIDIPALKIGDTLQLFSKQPIKMEKKATQPPPRYSEHKLIETLDAKGIGRPATYSSLISTITIRNYVEKRGSVFHATDLGKKITDELVKDFSFLDYDFTAKMEKQLDLIEAGKLDHIAMLKKFYPPFKLEIDRAYQTHGSVLCEKCGSAMTTRTNKANGSKFLSCSNFPTCKATKNLDQPKERAITV